MAQLPQEKLEALEKHFVSLELSMAANPKPEIYIKLAKEYSDLQPIIESIREYQLVISGIDDAKEMRDGGDKEMAEMASAELEELIWLMKSACYCCPKMRRTIKALSWN